MKYFISLIIFILLVAETNVHIISTGENKDKEFLRNIIAPYNRAQAERIIEAILLYSYKYNHPVKIIGRMCEVESGFRYWAVNKKYGARGLFQVRYFHDHVLYKIDEPQLRKKLLETGEHEKYWQQIGYNTNGALYILRSLVDKWGGYELALVAYWAGENSQLFRDCLNGKKNPKKIKYVKRILDL
jgi:hypothetical protein